MVNLWKISPVSKKRKKKNRKTKRKSVPGIHNARYAYRSYKTDQ